MQNTTIKQEKYTLSRKTKKNNTVIKAVFILSVLCCLLSTIAQATQAEYTTEQIKTAQLTYAETHEEYQAGIVNRKVVNTTVDGDAIFIEKTIYSTISYGLYISIEPMTEINTIYFECDSYVKDFDGNKYSPIVVSKTTTYVTSTGANRNPWTSTSIGGMIQGTNSISGTNYSADNANASYVKYSEYIHFQAQTYEKLATGRTYDRIKVTLPFETIQGLYVENAKLIINDTVYKITNELENTINQIEQGQDEAINAINSNGIEGVMNDLQDNLDNTLTEIVKYNNDTLNAIFYANILSGSAVMQIVMMISMTITIISYIIFGKFK